MLGLSGWAGWFACAFGLINLHRRTVPATGQRAKVIYPHVLGGPCVTLGPWRWPTGQHAWRPAPLWAYHKENSRRKMPLNIWGYKTEPVQIQTCNLPRFHTVTLSLCSNCPKDLSSNTHILREKLHREIFISWDSHRLPFAPYLQQMNSCPQERPWPCTLKQADQGCVERDQGEQASWPGTKGASQTLPTSVRTDAEGSGKPSRPWMAAGGTWLQF